MLDTHAGIGTYDLSGVEAGKTAEQTAERIRAAGGQARSSTVSVTDGDAVSSLFAEVVEEFGALDIVLNTAGILFGNLGVATRRAGFRRVNPSRTANLKNERIAANLRAIEDFSKL